MVRVPKYHQTREDRRHEAAGMRRHHPRTHESHGRKRGHQTMMDRRHEAEGMRKYHHEQHPSYHQTRRDRMHESEGMRRHNRGSHHNPGHGSMDRRHESEGMRHREGYREGLDDHFMGMISEDHHAPSNLPQVIVHKHYPMNRYMDNYELDDSIYGVDDNMHNSVHMLDEYPSGSMY